MPTQVQIRGASQATQEARTLSARELDINTTDGRLCVHDGSTAGGMRHVNARDAQNQEFTYAAASGTDTITATYAYTPSAYANGQKFGFKAANNNTGAATFNANSVGAVTIKKVSGGALADLEADDIVQNAYYELEYNGTYFVVVGGVGGGAGGGPKTTASLSGTSTAMTDIFTAGNHYKIVIPNLVIAAGGVSNCIAELSDNSGSSWISSGYTHKGYSSDGTTLRAGNSLTSDLVCLPNTLATGVKHQLEIELFDPAASGTTMFRSRGFIEQGGAEVWGVNTGSISMTFESTGILSDTDPIDSIRFRQSGSGGMAGNVQIYEYPTS